MVIVMRRTVLPHCQVEDKSVKWKSLKHNGVLFPPDYEPHGVRMLYDGQPVDLSPEQEEVRGALPRAHAGPRAVDSQVWNAVVG